MVVMEIETSWQIKYLHNSYLTKRHRFLIIVKKLKITLDYDDIKNNNVWLKLDSSTAEELLVNILLLV